MSESETKKHKASSQKLKKSREKGSIARSQDLMNFSTTSVTFVLVIATFYLLYGNLASLMDNALSEIPAPSTAGMASVLATTGDIYFMIASLFILPSLVTGILISIFYQKGFSFSPTLLAPDPKRISPVSGIKRIFGKRGWLEFGTGLLRLGVSILALTLIFLHFFNLTPKLLSCGQRCIPNVILTSIFLSIGVAILCFLVFGIIDGIVQNAIFQDEQKMTETERNTESKNQFGSPEVRKERNRLKQEMSQEAGVSGVGKPTMILWHGKKAVALRYHADDCPVPRLVFKKSGKEAIQLKLDLKNQDVPGCEAPELVGKYFMQLPGDFLKSDTYTALVARMKQLNLV